MTPDQLTALAARERLQAAHYRTGRAQFETRCESCMHCDSMPLRQHGRYCENHRTEVRTHGICDHWARRSAQR